MTGRRNLVPLSPEWSGKYVRLWLDRPRTRYVEGLVTPGTTRSTSDQLVLRIPGERGTYILSADRDLEELPPERAAVLRPLLERVRQKQWETNIKVQFPRTLHALDEVRATISLLRTETNGDVMNRAWAAIAQLVHVEAGEIEASVHAEYQKRIAGIPTGITTLSDYLHPSEDP